MNQRELERIEKDSIYTLRLTNDLKDQVINNQLSELNRIVKSNVKKRDLIVALITLD